MHSAPVTHSDEAYELERVIRQTAYEIGRLGLRLGRELTLTEAVPQEESDQLRADQELAYAALERHLRALTRLAARDRELPTDRSSHGPTDRAGRARGAS